MISRQAVSYTLRRIGQALLALFVANNLIGLLPLEITSAAWQLRAIDLLLSTAPFTLLGIALLFLSERHMSRQAKPLFSAKRLRGLSRLASIGFLLLIPVLVHAIWTQIRSADFAAQATIRQLERRVNAVRSVGSSSELITLSAGLPPDWQPQPSASLAQNRARLLARVVPELARLRTNVDQRKSQAIQVGLKDGGKNVMLALIYAWALGGIRHRLNVPESFDDSPMLEDESDEVWQNGDYAEEFGEVAEADDRRDHETRWAPDPDGRA